MLKTSACPHKPLKQRHVMTATSIGTLRDVASLITGLIIMYIICMASYSGKHIAIDSTL